jgi:phenylacetate-CoA ligase
LNLFDLSLQLNGYPIRKAKKHLKFIQSIDDKAAYRERLKWEIFNYHKEHTPYYQSLISPSDYSKWEDIPIMTKGDLQVPLKSRLSKNFNENKVYINKTSGSSGDPFVFAKDKWTHALTWAIIQDRFSWYDIDFNGSKQLRFYGIPLDKKGYLKERLKDWLSHRYRFPIFDLSDEAFEKLLVSCIRKKFDYINGYTSAVVQFAKFLDRENIFLKQICPSLKVCVVTSEMLFETDKQLMKRCFGVPIVNEYGASELDLIAFQNPDGAFQLNTETLFVEILDDQGQVVPCGEEGRIVITSLYNKAHPFIRYDIGDVGVISEDGKSIKKLIGRTDDLIVLPSGKKAAGLTFYYITKSIIEDDGNVKEFIIEQQTIDQFVIYYVSQNDLDLERKVFIKNEIENYLEPDLDIIFERRDSLKRSKNGKLKQFISKLNI